jgi:hypothetical protein
MMKSVIVFITKCYMGHQISEAKTGGVCDIRGRKQKYVEDFSWKTQRKEIAWKS